MALHRHGVRLRGVLDTQLAYELLTGHLHGGLAAFLGHLGLRRPTKKEEKEKQRMQQSGDAIWRARPLDPRHLQYANADVDTLLEAAAEAAAALGPDCLRQVCEASTRRASWSETTAGDRRRVLFDVQNGWRPSSHELLSVVRPQDALPAPPLHVDHSSVAALVAMVPEELQGPALAHMAVLTDIVLDKGRRPHAFCGDARVFLSDDAGVTVTQAHLDAHPPNPSHYRYTPPPHANANGHRAPAWVGLRVCSSGCGCGPGVVLGGCWVRRRGQNDGHYPRSVFLCLSSSVLPEMHSGRLPVPMHRACSFTPGQDVP